MRPCTPILAALCMAAFAASASDTFSQSATDRLLLSAQDSAISPAFVSAMTRGRHGWYLRGQRPPSIPFFWQSPSPAGIPFYWEAEDGSSVRRLDDGAFRIDAADARLNWTSIIDCLPAGWPQFACSDGQMHDMSAPDLSTIVVAGRTFSRILPEPPADLAVDALPSE